MSDKMSNEPRLLTPEEAWANLRFRGKSVTEFAKEHGFSKLLVYHVLKGRALGHRGQSHKIAVKLGIKAGIIEGETS
ncbi:MAG TPA: DNA-binding protein [Accumulibacter sp.]|uniref:DNA-binding protein n=1 Tax=Accumulibacter sp. TaxID=2053492 RepID=UPI002878F177|nr:DNA-binding protein [Accumulibacter sp.]HNC66189.1 DNA-binding protein [Thauera aminoaromatica]HNL91054.1 DNA-binding protein [Nitrospira sp.]MDS4056470.1 DNA-binding protein [Accumulibacter sp.]HMV05133.1 DNA-binding protein [Accumulibacter sp.]HMW56408.1 DNA-binding protein [Accumulibacter sp.]